MLIKIKKIIKENVRKFRMELICLRFRTFSKNKPEKNDSKNIMILVSRLNNGGAERAASNIADELNKKFNVILVTQDGIKENDYKCSARRIVLEPKIEKDSSTAFSKKQIKQLRKIKREENISHTISFCTKMNYLNVLSKISDETIISIRNYLYESEKEEKNIYMSKKNAKYADKIIAVSEILAKEQIERFKASKDKIHVINNFCDTRKIDNQLNGNSNQIDIQGDQVVLNVGRLCYQKGQIHLINAFRKVVEYFPDAKLIILGQGDLREKLEKRIKDLNLDRNVFLMGFQKNPYVYMKKSQVFVISSFYEGMSNVILEAMYCNLPVISTDCKAGTRDIIAPSTNLDTYNDKVTKEEYGILVPVIKDENDEELLADAIIELLDDVKLRYKYCEKSRERIKAFSKEKIINQWISIIEDT